MGLAPVISKQNLITTCTYTNNNSTFLTLFFRNGIYYSACKSPNIVTVRILHNNGSYYSSFLPYLVLSNLIFDICAEAWISSFVIVKWKKDFKCYITLFINYAKLQCNGSRKLQKLQQGVGSNWAKFKKEINWNLALKISQWGRSGWDSFCRNLSIINFYTCTTYMHFSAILTVSESVIQVLGNYKSKVHMIWITDTDFRQV